MHSLGPIRLQRFDDLLAREQRLRLFAQLVDFLDLLVELGDLGLEQRVPAVLVLDPCRDDHMHQADHGHRKHREADGERDKLALARLALLLTVGQ